MDLFTRLEKQRSQSQEGKTLPGSQRAEKVDIFLKNEGHGRGNACRYFEKAHMGRSALMYYTQMQLIEHT